MRDAPPHQSESMLRMSPEDLARRAQDTGPDARAAYAALIDQFHPRVLSFLLAKTRSRADAEDLAQDTFIRAWQKISTYDPQRRFSTWLFTIAARLAAGAARKSRPVSVLDESSTRARTVDPSAGLHNDEVSSRVWALADRVLSPDQRACLWLRYAEDLDIGEIAQVTRKSSVAVRVTLFRARQVLAEHIAADDPASPTPPPASSSPSSRPPAASAGSSGSSGSFVRSSAVSPEVRNAVSL